MEINNWYDAIDNGKFKVIKKMIENGFDATFDHNYGFRMAAFVCSLKLMTLLLENGANINVNQSYALRTSIYHNNIDCVKFLVKWNSLIPKNSLMIAIENKNMKIAEFLIENGADLDTGDDELFLKCVELRDYDFVKYLLDKNITLYFGDHSDDESPMRDLMADEQFEIIETMLKMGVPSHRLFYYAIYGGMKMIKLLCEYDLDCTKVDEDTFNEEWYYFSEDNHGVNKIIIFVLKNDFPREIKKNILEILFPHARYKNCDDYRKLIDAKIDPGSFGFDLYLPDSYDEENEY